MGLYSKIPLEASINVITPLEVWVNESIFKVSPSVSVSNPPALPSITLKTTFVSSFVETMSFVASGTSLTGFIIMWAVAVSKPPCPSETL